MFRKKSIVVLLITSILLAVSIAVTASEEDWVLLMRASTSAYTSAGPTALFGTAPGASDGVGPEDMPLDSTNDKAAYIASYQFGPQYTLYQVDKKAPILPGQTKVWDLLLWAGPGYTGYDLRLAWWSVEAKAIPDNINNAAVLYKIEVIQDPTGQHQGQFFFYGNNSIPTGTSTEPAGYLQWTSFPKIDAAYSFNNAIKLRFTAGALPEPSSILALASGLAGMILAIRRKR